MIFRTWETRWDIEGWKNNDKSGLKMKQQEGKLHKILWSLTLSCNSVILEGIVHKIVYWSAYDVMYIRSWSSVLQSTAFKLRAIDVKDIKFVKNTQFFCGS